MRDRMTLAKSAGFVIMLLSLTGFVALGATAAPASLTGSVALGPTDAPTSSALMLAGLDIADVDCADLITADTIGHEQYRRYGVAEKLQNDRFAPYEYLDYIICSTEEPGSTEGTLRLSASMYYLFDRGSGRLAVSYVEWEGPSAEPAPTPTPAPLQDIADNLDDDSRRTTVCIDAKTPILETGGENPEQFDFWGLLGNAPCGLEISGSICLDCGEDVVWRWLVPTSTGQEVGPCFTAQMAVEITGQELDEDEASRVARGLCNTQLGPGDQVCWDCMEEIPKPTPTPAPTKRPRKDPVCSDYLTPEVVGREAWEKYGIAEKLRANQIHRHLSDHIVCYGGRRIDGMAIHGDRLYYMFDIESGQLLVERIHWREDLPKDLPTPRISQQEAEAMVGGKVSQSWLAILSPDRIDFETGLMSSLKDPCWVVSSSEVHGDLRISRTTIINAITGEVLGGY